jgi:hypothetical protein
MRCLGNQTLTRLASLADTLVWLGIGGLVVFGDASLSVGWWGVLATLAAGLLVVAGAQLMKRVEQAQTDSSYPGPCLLAT